MKPSLALVAGALVFSALAARAGGGVVEINQPCALTGCFSGDGPGFPVEIDRSAGGSYRLTSDLVVPDENTTGIRIVASDVSVDLGGFAIVRAACVGSAAPCIPTGGLGNGIEAPVFGTQGFEGIHVRDGAIVGMGSDGVYLASSSASIRGVRARWNRLDGLQVGSGVVENCDVLENGSVGIRGGSGARIANNRVAGTGDDGIEAGASSLVVANVVSGTGGDGIEVSSDASVSGNVVTDTQLFGIQTGSRATVLDNGVSDASGAAGISSSDGALIARNRVTQSEGIGIDVTTGANIVQNSVSAGGAEGIRAGAGSLLEQNVVHANANAGMNLSAQASYRENAITANGGTVVGGLNLGGNACNGAVCP